MLEYVLIAVGSAIGGVARFWISGMIESRIGQEFPWGTLVVNVSGSFVIGLFIAIASVEGRWIGTPHFRNFFTVGLCGGYTTFSSFSLQTLHLAQEYRWLLAGGNVVLSLALCFVFVWAGFALGKSLCFR